tara:strand:+ start:4062 stop:4679 length:618 start_codon:yes stop_codon:yes gene_type:complete
MSKQFYTLNIKPNPHAGNGRVNLLNLTDQKFLMQDKIPVKTTSSPYTEALAGVLESNTLSRVFFSKENIEIIQNRLKKKVAELTNKNIDSQPINIIKVIMRNIFLQNAKHSCENIRGQISELNDLVVNECIPKILSGLDSYLKYQKDISSLAVPMDRPISTYTSQKLEFTGFFKKEKEKNEETRGDLSKFLENNIEISKNFKTLI